jgi:hypothetical protein
MEAKLTQEDLATLVNFYKQKADNLELNSAVLEGRLKRAEARVAELEAPAEDGVEVEEASTAEADD